MKRFLILILIVFCYCSKEKSFIIKDERYYLEEIKRYISQCDRSNTEINYNCLSNKIKNNIPNKYYVHVRLFKNKDGFGWEFSCIDTTLPGHEEELKKALKAAAGY